MCGVSYKEHSGGNGETEVRFLADGDIPDDVKAIGLTKGEFHRYELDTSD